jgi:hypothetical protein
LPQRSSQEAHAGFAVLSTQLRRCAASLVARCALRAARCALRAARCALLLFTRIKKKNVKFEI